MMKKINKLNILNKIFTIPVVLLVGYIIIKNYRKKPDIEDIFPECMRWMV